MRYSRHGRPSCCGETVHLPPTSFSSLQRLDQVPTAAWITISIYRRHRRGICVYPLHGPPADSISGVPEHCLQCHGDHLLALLRQYSYYEGVWWNNWPTAVGECWLSRAMALNNADPDSEEGQSNERNRVCCRGVHHCDAAPADRYVGGDPESSPVPSIVLNDSAFAYSTKICLRAWEHGSSSHLKTQSNLSPTFLTPLRKNLSLVTGPSAVAPQVWASTQF